MKTKKNVKFPSELRLDLISQDWVVIATGRAKRPKMFKKKGVKKINVSPSICPFCDIEASKKFFLIYSQGKKILDPQKITKNWTTIAIPNKYPALLPYDKLEKKVEGGLYERMNGVGFCELVVMKDHYKHFPHFDISQIKEVFDVYQERYCELMKKPFVNYISIFHNHGLEAGASQPHPHSQIITTPLIDIDLRNDLLNSKKYFKKNKKCIYCQMIAWEKKMKKRIVCENEYFLALCPFASKSAFEVIISPKKHHSYFEESDDKDKWQLAEIFQLVFRKLYKSLGDISYNFYLHTSPCDERKYSYFHWHWTILPKTGTWAGFEIGTRMEISTIEPEKAAEYLRKQ